MGAQLVTITSAEEQDFVSTLVGQSTRWSGLSRFGTAGFSWITAERVTYENWESGSPSIGGVEVDVAVVIRNETNKWFDVKADQQHAALCERPQPNP